MPIKISVENNFLKVEGNDPERIYYERSRVSHELLPTYVQLRYDNNKLAQLDLTTLDSTNTAFTSLAAIVAFLTEVGDGDTNAGGSAGGGGGGLTQAQAQAAFTAALQSQAQTEFQDILLEDANGVVYISTRQIDEETGAVTFTSRLPDGTAHTPVTPITVPKIQTPFRTDFWANIAGTGYDIGDRLERIITGSTISWYNRTTETPIASPTLTNLVTDVRQAIIRVLQTTSANSVDHPQGSLVFTDSSVIPIPKIGGFRANSLYVYRTSVGTASPLFPADVGALGGVIGVTGVRVLIPGQATNRQRQHGLAPAGTRSYLDEEIDSVFVRNYNLGTHNLVFDFGYDPDFAKEARTDQPETKLLVQENQIDTPLSTPIFSNSDIVTIGFYVGVTNATTTVSFVVEQSISLGGVARWYPIITITLPAGATQGFSNINFKARGGQFRIASTGTFTNYSYRLLFN